MQKKIWQILLAAVFLMLTGCAQMSDQPLQEETEESQEAGAIAGKENASVLDGVFFLTTVDTEGKKLTLQSSVDLREYTFSYTGGTQIYDKYGGSLSVSQLTPGEGVVLKTRNGILSEVQISEEVFSYDKVHNFKLNTTEKMLTVGKSNYYFDENLMIFYRSSRISLAEISTEDTLCLKGIGRKIYAIQVTNGHGTVVLENTTLFEGGYIVIGNITAKKVEAQMRLQVPEGVYQLSVANNGYGGTREILVTANTETVVNLEDLQGEGPKIGTIQFAVTPENAIIFINGNPIDNTQPQQLSYGSYALGLKAEGYEDWNGTLVVSSEQATVKLEMTTSEEAAAQKAEEEAAQEKAEEEAKENETQEKLEEIIDTLKNNIISTSGAGSGTVNVY